MTQSSPTPASEVSTMTPKIIGETIGDRSKTGSASPTSRTRTMAPTPTRDVNRISVWRLASVSAALPPEKSGDARGTGAEEREDWLSWLLMASQSCGAHTDKK